MALMKFCDKCKTKYPYEEECPNRCKAKAKKEADSYYDSRQRCNAKFYNSKSWKKLRLVAINKFDGLCLWSYIKHKRVVRGTVVHHIVEIKNDMNRALDIDNLILMSDEAHREIHQLYKIDKRATQEELLKIIKIWNNRER